jgi:CheY-like chemotaxis protein
MGKRILVVDDFTTIQNFVRATLERKGYNTLGASNGQEAYRIISEASEAVDLVLTDYNMPRGTGYDLLKKIKENPATAHIPVIFLTTELSYDKMKSAKEAGLFAWIKKPYRSEAFFEMIENALAENVKNLDINQ